MDNTQKHTWHKTPSADCQYKPPIVVAMESCHGAAASPEVNLVPASGKAMKGLSEGECSWEKTQGTVLVLFGLEQRRLGGQGCSDSLGLH